MEQNELAKSLNVIYQPHPIAPLDGRKGLVAVTDGTATVRQVLLSTGVDPHQVITVQLDGRLLPVDEWDIICPTEGQLLSVHGAVQGGGGDSNALQVVAMIALVVVATALATATTGPLGTVIVGELTVGMVAGAVVSVAGSYLLGALFAPKPPAMPNAPAAVSPTYSLAGGQNRGRPYEPMAAVMGTHRIFFDYSAKPYTEYRGNEQYLYQIFNTSLGNFSLSELKIGATDITSYSDYELVYPNVDGKLENFPGNVDTASGATLTNAAGWIERTTSITTYQIGLDFESIIFYANDKGALDSRSVEIEIQYKKSSDSTWLIPESLDIYGDGYSYDGASLTVTGSTQKPLRGTIYISGIDSSQYDVRVRRITADSEDAKLTLQTNWSTIRSYQEDNATYSGQNRLGLIIKATDQLNGVVQQLSALINATAQYWNGSAWVTGETSNPAHWFMHFSRGVYNSDGKLMYGIGLSDSQIDLESLSSWANFCATEGLTFNAVIDTNVTAADVLQMLGAVGFASPTWASGKLGVVWDARNSSPVMTFGMSNIIKDSFEVAYISENLAEEIVVKFSNPEKDYIQDEVRTLAPGVVSPQRTSAVELFGCTNTTMAGKFSNYLAAQQYYRRRRISWQSDFEGFVCQRGDVVILSHDLTQWGYSGRVTGFQGTDADTDWEAMNQNWNLANFEWEGEGTITLDREIPRNGETEYFMLTRPDGVSTIYEALPVTGSSSTITLVQEPDFQEGYATYDHRWSFSPLATPGKKVKIISIAPASDARLQIVATDEYPEFYDAWDGSFVPPSTQTLLGDLAINITDLTATSVATYVDGVIKNRITARWGKGGGVQQARVKVYFKGELIDDISQYVKTFYQYDTDSFGTFRIEVTPFGFSGAGLPASYEFEVTELSSLAAPSNLQSIVAEDGKTVTFTWDQVVGASSYEVKVLTSGTPRREVNIGNSLSYTYTVDDAIQDGGAFRAFDFQVYAATVAGISTNYSEVSYSNPQIPALQNISVEPLLVGVSFKCDKPTDPDFKAIRIWLSTSSSFTPADNLIVYDGELTKVEIQSDGSGFALDPEVVYYIKAAGYDSFGDDNLNISASYGATSLSGVFTLVEDSISQELLDAGLRDEIDKIAVNETAITTEQTVREAADLALASDITSLTAVVDDNTAAIVSEATARADADTALASSITTLQTTVGGNTTSIETNATSINGIEAKYTVKIDNNGYISGYGLISTANDATPTSTFAVLADKFVIGDVATSYDTDTSVPFFVLTSPQVIDGVTVAAGTYIKKASIMDAAITNAKIANAAITSAKIGDAEITTAKIGTAQIDTLRIAGNAVTTSAALSRSGAGSASATVTLTAAGLITLIVNTRASTESAASATLYVNATSVGTVQGAQVLTGYDGFGDPIYGQAESTRILYALGVSGDNTISVTVFSDLDVTVSILATLR